MSDSALNPNNQAENQGEIRDYDITEYVPAEGRHFSFKDMMATWTCANANPTSWYVGNVIGALGLTGAVLAASVGNPVVYFILALVGYMGYKVGTSTMGLARVSFGITGSKVPSVINSMQFFGWCSVNTYIAAISMTYLLNYLFKVPAYGTPGGSGTMAVSIFVIMIITGTIAMFGGSRAIKLSENLAVVALVILSVWITYVALTTFSLSDIIAWKPDESIKITFGSAIDAIAALGIAWVMAVADYTRYTKTKAASTVAPMLGATFGMFWFCLVGSLSVIAVAVSTGVFDPYTADPATICAMLGLGQIANVLIIVSTIAVNLINVYSAGYSTANFSETLKPKTSMMIVTALAIVVALIPLFVGSFLDLFQVFLGYLGAVFPPCIAIILVDYYLLRKQKYDISQLGTKGGAYWYGNGINWYAMLCFAAGVVSYFASMKLAFVSNYFGSVFFCFFFTAILYYIVGSAVKGKMIVD
ncbi:purine-cytosine permease family protein [Dehalobacterium formicoaceticum]|uniref:purine-cytosine permease family protein n=1 Tax=Dehalobacterium formicoaceticum TaxID=51515 RepID=UPI000B7FB830|nr:cytosine permease [Dehalobacterium formicoaceticum]